MKKWIGQFIFDFAVKYVQNLGAYDYEKFFSRTERPSWARYKSLPESDGREMRMYFYSPKPEGINPAGPRFL